MAKILTFRNKGDTPSDQGFLTDENQTLSFRTDENGGVSVGSMGHSDLPHLFPDLKKDWSNQELANLFRVRQLLSGANVAVETDRGVTDEGDPWFVFCHAGGEVFIHLCRIDGFYLLDSPNILRPLHGADFNELIADFTDQALPGQGDEDETKHRVIKLERGGTVRLHPSAMLAALIWTLFLASEELVLLVPEEQALDDDDLLDFDGMFAVETSQEIDSDLLFDNATIVDTASLQHENGVLTDQANQDVHAQTRDTILQQQQGLTVQNNAFTMGLSTIAIAMGFMSEAVLLDNQRKVLESLKELGFSEYGTEAERVAEVNIPANDSDNPLLAMLAEFLGLDLSLNTDVVDAPVTNPKASQLQDDLAHLSNQGIAPDTALSSEKPANMFAVRKKDAETDAIVEPDMISRDAASDAMIVPIDNTLEAEAGTTLTPSEVVQNWQSEMEEFQLGETTVKSSFQLSDIDAFALFDLIGNTQVQRTTNFREFDDLAQRLIDYLQAKDGEFGVIELPNEIIMIDRTAVTGGEIEYMHWETSEGKIISVVGLASDFQQFDMIA